MNRRTIVATAGAATLTVLAGTAAVAANVGILGQRAKEPVGQLSPVAQVQPAVPVTTSPTTAAPRVETVYVDDYGPAGSAGSARASDVSPDPAPPAAGAPASTVPAAPVPAAVAPTERSHASTTVAVHRDDGHESGDTRESSGAGEHYPGARADD